MPNGPFQDKLHDEQRNGKPYHREKKIKSLVIVHDELVLQQVLDKVREVLDHNCANPGSETYERA